jgi:putative DNA primase/helicase
VLVVAQKRIRKALTGLGMIPANVQWVHHNAARGLNDWRHVQAIIIIGRTLPSSESIRRMAEALTGTALPDLAYERAEVWREMADGTMQRAEGIRCPEPIAEAMRWQACEGELLQLIGRPRGVRRTAADPVDVLLLTDVALPVPVAETLTAADLEPSPADRMLAKGGVALANPAHASAAYPELWRTRAAAKSALQRDQMGANPYSQSTYTGMHPSAQGEVPA